MAESEKKENGNGERPATKSQCALIGKLLQETGSTEIPASYTNETMTVKEACDYIDYLKELKSRDYQDRMNGKRVDGFDRIAFGMIYKLCWRAISEDNPHCRPCDEDFIDKVYREYNLYLATRDYVKSKVAEGGQR